MLTNIYLIIRDLKFSGEVPILTFELLTLVVEEANSLEVNEVQLIVFLLHLLIKNAAQHFRSASNHSHSVRLFC